MKKNYLFLMILIPLYCATAQTINFPDPNLKIALLNNGIARDANGFLVTIDANNDGEIQIDETLLVDRIEISIPSINITDITGLSEFLNLKKLHLVGQNIQSIDLTGLNSLEKFEITYCETTSINTTGLINLKTLNCISSQLTNAGLNLSTNLALTSLNLYGNQLTSLNVNFLTELIDLSCGNNNINTLDITNLEHLSFLECSESNLTSLNLVGLQNLTVLDCSKNALTSLNLNGFSNLTTLTCNNNALTELDLSFENMLEKLNVSNNNLTSIDVSGCEKLHTFDCTDNQLIELDFSQNPLLYFLYANNNLLKYINLKNGNPFVSQPELSNNPTLAFVCIDANEYSYVLDYFTENFPDCIVNDYCSFVPGGNYHTLTGVFKFDSTSNGCDTNDNILPLQGFTIDNGSLTDTVMTNATAGYTLGLPAGTYTLTPLNPNPAYFTVEPASVVLTLSDSETEDLHVQNYCLSPIGIFHDLDITILPVTPARPGFDAKYRIIYRNKGNTTQFAGIFFTYNDAVLDFVSSSIVPNANNPGSLFWEIPNLKPFEEGVIDITINANAPTETPALNIDDVLHFEANIQNPIPEAIEQTPLDNTYKLDQVVVGSFDPNDKTCVEGTTITPEMAGEYVTYMIRFENTGTYAAENVVVQDKIDIEKFEIGSLTPLRSSHPFVTRITEDNNVEFIFENIMLPGMPNEERHGYVAFKIKTKATLQLNDTFSNTAAIYFDYNAPVITNEAVTTFAITQSNPDFDFNRYITIYPNPAATVVNLEVNSDIIIESLEVYNIVGQMVLTMPKANNTSAIDVASLASGTYILKVTSNKGTSNSKFIIK